MKTKSILSAILSACMLMGSLTLAGCGAKTITLDEMEKTSQTAELLKNNTSFQTTVTYAEADFTITQYADKDMFYIIYPEQTNLFLNNTLEYISVGDTVAGAFFVLTEPTAFHAKDNFLFTYSTEESIKNCEEKDGKLYISTELSAKGAEKHVTDDGYTYNEGEYMAIDYVLDPKTNLILSNKEVLVAPDGTKRDYSTATVEYNIARPEMAQTMYEHATATEDLRTLTIVTDPDTDAEQSFSTQVPKGDAIQPYTPEDYVTLFTDRACTEQVSAIDRNADATVYMAKGK